MIQSIYELPTAYNDHTVIKAGRCFHNFSSGRGTYYELFLGRDIMVDLSWHKYKIVYRTIHGLSEIVFMVNGVLNLNTFLGPNREPLVMYPIWHKCQHGFFQEPGSISRKQFCQANLFIDSINELLTISDIVPNMNIPFCGVQSVARFIREVLLRTYGDAHAIYLDDVMYGMSNTDPQDVVSTVTTVLDNGCDPMALDCEVYEPLIGTANGNKEDWIRMIGVRKASLDPLAIWFASRKHLSTELINHLDMGYNIDRLSHVTSILAGNSNRATALAADGFPMLSESVGVDYDPSDMDFMLDYILCSNGTDFKFNVVGNTTNGLQERFIDSRNIYKNVEMQVVSDSTYVNDNLIYSLLNQQSSLPVPRQSHYEVEKTWTEELWIRNTETGETHYADIVWRILASSLGMINKTVTNQLQ